MVWACPIVFFRAFNSWNTPVFKELPSLLPFLLKTLHPSWSRGLATLYVFPSFPAGTYLMGFHTTVSCAFDERANDLICRLNLLIR